MRAFASTLAACALAGAPARAGDITIDGRTATTLTALPGGGTRIGVAPKDKGGKSHNSYRDFNVGRAGIELDNRSVGAGLIVNEVTSTNRSRIEGRVEVLGDRADVVIANPNGVTVDGGSFVNTGRAALVAGRSKDGAAPGAATFSVTDADVTVAAGGLRARIDALSLVAGALRIDGDIALEGGALSLRAGTGEARIADPLAFDWLVHEPDGGAGRITIARGAMLSGGSIDMIATGEGAGVNALGSGLATSGGYTITSDGRVVIEGDHEARKTLVATGADVEVAGDLSSREEAVQLASTGDLAVKGGRLSGAGRGYVSFGTDAAVSLRAGGALTVRETDIATGSDDVSLDARGSISISGGMWRGAADIGAIAGGDLAIEGLDVEADGRIDLRAASGTLGLDVSTLAAVSGVTLLGRDIALESRKGFRTRVEAIEGGATLIAENDLVNRGALVSGRRRTEGEPLSLGGVTLTIGGDFHNAPVSRTSLASIFATEDPLVVDVAGTIRNESGRLLAANDASIRAGHLVNGVARRGARTERFTGVVEKTARYGTYAIGREIGQITAGDTLDIEAERFENVGGDVLADMVAIEAGTALNAAGRFGSFEPTKRCFLFFCRRSARSDLFHDGGTIAASSLLTVEARRSFTNEGGRLEGFEGITLSAPKVVLTGLVYRDHFSRPGGFISFFAGSDTRSYLTFDPGAVVSLGGEVRITSEGEVVIEGTDLIAAGGLVAPDRTQRRDQPGPMVGNAFRGEAPRPARHARRRQPAPHRRPRHVAGRVSAATTRLARGRTALALLAAAAMIAAPLLAASPGARAQVAGQGVPDQVKERLLEERRENALRERAENAEPDTRIASAEDAAAAGGPCFPIGAIDVEGVTLLDPAALEAIIAPYANSCMGQVAVDALLQAISQAYLDEGLITSRAYLPEQDLATGRLAVVVIEGRIEAIEHARLVGGASVPGRPWTVGAAFPTAPGDVLDLRAIEQGVDNMNAASSSSVKLDIAPGSEVGGSVLKLTQEVEDRTRLYVRGKGVLDDLGDVRTADILFEHDGLLGLGDSLFLGYSGGADSNALSASIAVPIGWWSHGASLNYSESLTLLTPVTEFFERTVTGGLSTRYLVHRDAQSKWFLDGRVGYSLNERFVNATELEPQEMATGRVGAAVERYGEGYYVGLGLGVVGGTLMSERPAPPVGIAPRDDFWLLDASATVRFAPTESVTVLSILDAQYASAPQFSPQQLTIGGRTGLRGLGPRSFGGDSGVTVRNELAFPTLDFGACCRISDPVLREVEGFARSLRPFAFVDGGWVHNIAIDRDSYGVGAGIGLRASYKRLSMEAFVAHPLARSDDLDDAGFSLGIELTTKVF